MFLIAPRLDYIEGPTIVLSSTLWERIIKSLLTYDKKDAWKFPESCAGYAYGVSTSYYNPLRDGVCQFFAVKESFSPLGFLVNHAIFRAERYVLILKNGVLD